MTEHGVTEHDLFGRSGYGVQDIGLASAAVGPGYTLSAQHEGVRVYGLLGSSLSPSLFQPAKDSGTKDAKQASDGSAKQMPECAPTLQKKSPKAKGDDDTGDEADPMDRLTGFLWEVGLYNSTNLSQTAPDPNPSDYSARLNMYFSGDSFIGLAGYSGLMTVGTGTGEANRYQFGGPDFSYYFGKPIEKSQGMMIKPFNLMGGYISGLASNPNADGTQVSWNGYYFELDYAVTPRSMCFVRYDKVNSNNFSDLEPTVTDAVTANYTYYIRTNFFVGLEYTADMTSLHQNLLGLLFDFAF